MTFQKGQIYDLKFISSIPSAKDEKIPSNISPPDSQGKLPVYKFNVGLSSSCLQGLVILRPCHGESHFHPFNSDDIWDINKDVMM